MSAPRPPGARGPSAWELRMMVAAAEGRRDTADDPAARRTWQALVDRLTAELAEREAAAGPGA